jgi:hypothetical protein
MWSVGQTLSTPLLSTILEHEGDECDADYSDEEEEEGCKPCPLKILSSNEELDEVSGDDSGQPSWVVWYHALLFLQLGMVFCMSGTEATVVMGLWWSLLSYVIVVFVSNATLCRQAIKGCKLTCLAVLLAPDILVIIIMGLMIFEQKVAFFKVMLGSILCLAISIRGLIATSGSAEEDNCEQLPGELDVSLFGGGRIRTTRIV